MSRLIANIVETQNPGVNEVCDASLLSSDLFDLMSVVRNSIRLYSAQIHSDVQKPGWNEHERHSPPLMWIFSSSRFRTPCSQNLSATWMSYLLSAAFIFNILKLEVLKFRRSLKLVYARAPRIPRSCTAASRKYSSVQSLSVLPNVYDQYRS